METRPKMTLLDYKQKLKEAIDWNLETEQAFVDSLCEAQLKLIMILERYANEKIMSDGWYDWKMAEEALADLVRGEG